VAAEGGRVRAFVQRLIDRFQHSHKITITVAIPETKDTEALDGKGFIPPCVPRLVRIEIVLAAIKLNDQPMLQANEIHDVALARRLPAKMISVIPPRPKVNP
jgi:hypothetical protein